MSETTKKTTTRRALMGNAGVAALAGVATVAIAKPDSASGQVPAPAGGDAQLVVFCNQFMILQAELDGIEGRVKAGEDVADSEFDPVTDAQAAIIEKMDALTATTPAGHRARAMVFDKMWTRDEGGNFDLVLSWHDIAPLIRDLMGSAA